MFETLFKYPLEQFLNGRVRLGSGLRVELALLAVAAAAVGTVYFYRRAPVELRGSTRVSLSALRGLSLGLIIVILFGPVLQTPRRQRRDTFLVVLVDDSRSMRIRDVAAAAGGAGSGDVPRDRLALAKWILVGPRDDKLMHRLGELCPVQTYRFSAAAEPVDSPADLRGAGERTDIYAALRQVDADLRGVPVAGIVLVSDGAVSTDARAPRHVAKELGARNRPVYCIGLGDPQPPQDYEVLRVHAPRRVRSNASVEIFANVRINGFDEPFDVVLRQGRDRLQTLEGVVPETTRGVQRVRLAFRPEKKGTFTYTVEVPPHEREVIRENNRRDFIVHVADDRLPVLYLEGSPRTEYRFLRRAMLRDKDFRIASVLRLGGPKKFITQGAQAEDGLEAGYPRSLEHLGRFQAVIFGDIDAAFLTGRQLEITEEFVKRRGGGFLMLGGVNSFNLGGYEGTPIADMLPVVLPPPSVPYKQTEFRLHLTKAGEAHSIMRQSPNVVLNRDVWSKAPALIGYNPVMEVKPLARVLAVEPKTNTPILTVQAYGAGKTAAFVTGGSWHWRMLVPLGNELHEKFWKQLIRWLAVGARAKLRIELDKDRYSLGESVRIRAIVLDRTFQPVNDARVDVQITDPYGQKLKSPEGVERPMRVGWTLGEAGVYAAQYEPPDAGEYLVAAAAKVGAAPVLTATATFSVGETLDEYADVGQKVDVLKEIASLSGGRYFQPHQAKDLADLIERRVGEKVHEETLYEQRAIWDTPLWFGLIVAALSAEWIIRRRASLV